MKSNLLEILLVFLFIWLGSLSFLIWRIWRHYQRLVAVKKGNLAKILEKLIKHTKDHEKNFSQIVNQLERLERKSGTHFQKIGLVRFNPFGEVGGEQSFALAVLDQEGRGFVITGLHGRSATRFYAKIIRQPKDLKELSREEKLAVAQAKRASK